MKQEDHVDKVLRESGLEAGGERAVEVASRVYRFAGFLDRVLAKTYAPHGLNHGEADVLFSLARSGAELLPTQIAGTLMCSSGAMTNRLDRLERAGLISRSHDTVDRRAIRIALTAEGRRVAKRAMDDLAAIDAELVPALTKEERRQFVALLREVLCAFESEAPAAAAKPVQRAKRLPAAAARRKASSSKT